MQLYRDVQTPFRYNSYDCARRKDVRKEKCNAAARILSSCLVLSNPGIEGFDGPVLNFSDVRLSIFAASLAIGAML